MGTGRWASAWDDLAARPASSRGRRRGAPPPPHRRPPRPARSDEAFTGVGAALTYDRFCLSLDLTTPLVVKGKSSAIGGYAFTGPSVDPGTAPTRGGHATWVRRPNLRRLGEALRFSAGAQLCLACACPPPTITHLQSRRTLRHARGSVLFSIENGSEEDVTKAENRVLAHGPPTQASWSTYMWGMVTGAPRVPGERHHPRPSCPRSTRVTAPESPRGLA